MRTHIRASDLQPASRAETSGGSRLRIFILSDVRLYREGLAGSLAQREDVRVIGVMTPVDDALGQIAESGADAVILDIGTPGALRFAAELDRLAPSVKIVAFAVNEIDNELIACAEAGIVGYIERDGSIEDLVSALRSAVRGEVTCTPHHAALLVKRLAALRDLHSASEKSEGQTGVLTSREREIASLVREGLSNKEIARSLRIGSAAVKNHVHSILTKLQAKSRGQAAAALHRAHLEAHPPARLR